MVCVSSRGPNPPRLLREAAWRPERFNAPWYAVYVKTPGESVERVDAATQRQVGDSLALGQQFGGIAMPFSGPTFAAAVAGFVAEYRITHLVPGQSQRP